MTSVCHSASSDKVMPLSRKRRLPLVREADAAGRTLEIYQEIKTSLGVPRVNLIFQASGAHPQLLDLAWKSLQPAVATRELFRCAERIRGEAYTAIHTYFSVPGLWSGIRSEHFASGCKLELTDVV